jgi:sulfate transport system substrate-binding protein
MNPKVILGLLGLYLLGGTLWYLLGGSGRHADVELLNVSYDPTRELYKEINALFAAHYEKETGLTVVIKQSHGGSSSQARSVIDGLQADVATLAMWNDVDALSKAGLIKPFWEKRMPNNSCPFFSTIVFVVRKGNPKQIADWPDIVRPGVQIITPNPKTSGNGQMSFLAAWGSVRDRGGSDQKAEEFVTQLYRQTPVLDTGARGASTTFAQKKIGDVHLTWENEAHLEVEEAGDTLQIVYPPASLRAEPPVAVIDENAKRKKTIAVAAAYLNFLYTDAAQETIARHFYRPVNAAILKKYEKVLLPLKLFPITTVTAGGWAEAQQRFFSAGGVFDLIYEAKK